MDNKEMKIKLENLQTNLELLRKNTLNYLKPEDSQTLLYLIGLAERMNDNQQPANGQ